MVSFKRTANSLQHGHLRRCPTHSSEISHTRFHDLHGSVVTQLSCRSIATCFSMCVPPNASFDNSFAAYHEPVGIRTLLCQPLAAVLRGVYCNRTLRVNFRKWKCTRGEKQTRNRSRSLHSRPAVKWRIEPWGLRVSTVPLNTHPPPWAFGVGPGLSWSRPSMPTAFQEHTTVTDGGLLLNGIVCRVILLSGYVLWTA